MCWQLGDLLFRKFQRPRLPFESWQHRLLHPQWTGKFCWYVSVRKCSYHYRYVYLKSVLKVNNLTHLNKFYHFCFLHGRDPAANDAGTPAA